MENAMDLLRSPGFADLCRERGVTLAVLFGSRAKGQAAASSDIDLALSIDCGGGETNSQPSPCNRRSLMKAIADYLRTSSFDLLILNRAGSLVRFEVAKAGKVLYEGRPGLFAEFCSLAVREHEDSKVFYRAMDRYLARATERGE